MVLNIILDEQTLPMKIPDQMLIEAEDFFHKMDADMDNGWQMSRSWVDRPNKVQRCKIVADKMLTAIVNENSTLAVLLGAYILKRLPGIKAINVDTEGDMTATELVMLEGAIS
jgi:hypothetical protein